MLKLPTYKIETKTKHTATFYENGESTLFEEKKKLNKIFKTYIKTSSKYDIQIHNI